jgi:RNA polymerase sigma-70 factor (ECF subfamily)
VSADAENLLEHLFRHQSGRMVAHLTRLLGPAHIDLAEEAVQDTMLRALQSWPYHGVPENPPAWLFRVAHNLAIDTVRRHRMMDEKAETILAELSHSAIAVHPDIEEQIRDDELRMIFMCCHPEIPQESRVALSLKTVSGFSVREIARAFLAEDTAIAQRLARAKRQIRDQRLTLDPPCGPDMQPRLQSVLEVIYLIFNEGYTAHAGEDLIRTDLCYEALRLASLVAASSIATPRAHALMALLAFQAARLPARVDEAGDLVLFEHQDRARWDQHLIQIGFRHFNRSMTGDEVSLYHAQAAIAANYAVPGPIDWNNVLTLYDDLLALYPSPVAELNRAVAIAKAGRPAEALAELERLANHPQLRDYYLMPAARGHLLFELGRRREAAGCFRQSLECPCSEPERRFLKGKLTRCEDQSY